MMTHVTHWKLTRGPRDPIHWAFLNSLYLSVQTFWSNQHYRYFIHFVRLTVYWVATTASLTTWLANEMRKRVYKGLWMSGQSVTRDLNLMIIMTRDPSSELSSDAEKRFYL